MSCVWVPLHVAGLTVAEYFRDVEGQDVLLFVDNIFRFTQVRAWLSTLSAWHCLAGMQLVLLLVKPHKYTSRAVAAACVLV